MRTLALLLIAAANAFAQCTIDGTVVNTVNGTPIERAHISISTADDIFFADSNPSGKWALEHIPCGQVTVIANRPGFLKKQITATASDHDIKLQLAPHAVLAGRVLDEQGDPILGAEVSLMTSRIIGGLRGTQASASEVTNDLGEYRFSGLAAGKYEVCANAGGGAVIASGERIFGEKCYPGSMPMEVIAGYEGRVDLTLSPLATVQVSGVVSGRLDGTGATVRLAPRGQIARMYMNLFAQVKPDGTFVIRHVPPASYLATVASENTLTYTPIEVGSSGIDALQLHLEPGVSVTGTVKPIPANIMDLQLVHDLGIGSWKLAQWKGDRSSFTFADMPAGNYRVQLIPPAPFYVKSVTLGGRDISHADFMVGPGIGNIEVILADDGGTIEGDVSEPAWVLLQKDGVSLRNDRTDEKGHFKIDNLPPGDYNVYAWDDNTNVEYGNPDWMRQNAKGADVSVAPKQTTHVTVTRQTGPPI